MRAGDGIWKIVGVGIKTFGRCFVLLDSCDRQLNPQPFIDQQTKSRSTLTHRVPPESIDSEYWKYIVKQLLVTRFGWWASSSSPAAFRSFQIEICMYRLMELVKERNNGSRIYVSIARRKP